MTPGADGGTEQTNVRPWCGGDVDALTLAVPLPHTVLGAISAAHHGSGLVQKKFSRALSLGSGMFST